MYKNIHNNMILFFNVYFFNYFERERESMAEEGQRETHTQNPKQAPGSRLQAVSTEPNAGFELMNYKIMT